MYFKANERERESERDRERERERERAAGSEHRFLAVGTDFRWKEIALLPTALAP